MKRSRSGSRPSTGGQKNIARAHVRYNYQLACVTSDGHLEPPTEEDMAYFNDKFPEIAKKLHDSAHNAGFEPGSWQETCYRILDGLIKQKRAVWFRNPVDPQKEGLTDYFQVIKEPMDLGTVKMRLTNGFYTEASAFAAAVRLTFNNATTYNRPTTQPHDDASKLVQQFDRKYNAHFHPTASALAGDTVAASSADAAGHTGTDGGLAIGREAGAAGGDGGGGDGDGGGGSGQPPPPSSGFDADDAEWGGGAAATAEQPKAVISDDESDDDDDDDDDDDARRTEGSKAPKGAAEAGKHPATGGKAPAGMDDSGLDETAESEADMSDSALDSQAESGDEGNGEDGDLVSEADMFGDEDDEGFDFEQNGNDDESEAVGDSEAEGDGYGGESSMAEGEYDDGDDDDDEEDEFI